MQFINNGDAIKFRIGNKRTGYDWITLRNGEAIEIEKTRGISLGLTSVEARTITTNKGIIVETKQVKGYGKKQFLAELQNIPGIGKKTAEDLFLIFPTKEALKYSLDNGRIPIRDDVEIKLREAYGR